MGLEWKLLVVLSIVVCICILGLVLVPSVWGQCNDRLSLKLANIVSSRYTYTRDILQLGGFTRAKTAPLWPVSPMPLKLANWRDFLSAHPDQEFAAYIYSGLLGGFKIGFDQHSVYLRPSRRNHPSAHMNEDVVRDYIMAERDAGRLVGPFQHSDLPCIHEVNDGVSSTLSSLSYSSVDDVVDLILCLGKGARLVEVDLKHAYRQILVHPQDHHLLGIMWKHEVYVVPFGTKDIFDGVRCDCMGISHGGPYTSDPLPS